MMNHSTEATCSLEFFKIFLPDSGSHHMIIPPSFVKHLNGTFPKKTTIEDHMGKSWRVTLEKLDDLVFFNNGWKDFVDYHFLSYGDFLIFQYDGDCTFDVKIFAKNGCKKAMVAEAAYSVPIEEGVIPEAAYFVPIEEGVIAEAANSVPIVEDVVPEAAYSVSILEDVVPEAAYSVPIEEGVIAEAGNSVPTVKAVDAVVCNTVSILEVKEEPVVENEDVSPSISSKRKRLQVGSRIVHKRRIIAARNRGRPLDPSSSVEHVGQRGPFFERMMKHWSSKTIYIPGCMVRDHKILLKPNLVLRDEDGDLWHTKICSTSQNRISLTVGWSKFYKTHKLKLNDKCEFEFVLEKGNVCRQLNVKVTRRRRR